MEKQSEYFILKFMLSLITSHLSERLKLTTQATADVGEDVEKEDLFALLVEMQAGAATMKNSMEVPQKTKNRTTL